MKSRMALLFPFFFLLYEMAGNLSNDLYLPAMPQIAQQFNTNTASIGFTIALWLAGDACFQWLLGPLSDKFGRRAVLFSGGILFIFSTFMCAFSSQLSIMLIGRFIQGIGVSSMMIAGYASIHESFSDQDAVKILAWMTSITILAPMMGPLLGGYLLMWVEWPWLFIFIALLALMALVGLAFTMPTSQHIDRHALKFSKIKQGYWQLLQNRLFMWRSMTMAFVYSAVITWITGSPTLLMNNYQLTSFEFGIIQCPIFGGNIIGAQLGQKLITKYASDALIQFGITLSMMSCGSLFILLYFSFTSLWIIISLMTLIILGAGIVTAPLNRACFQSTTQPKGIVSAMFYMCLLFSGTLLSMLISTIKAENAALLSIIIGITLISAWISFKKVKSNLVQN